MKILQSYTKPSMAALVLSGWESGMAPIQRKYHIVQFYCDSCNMFQFEDSAKIMRNHLSCIYQIRLFDKKDPSV